MQQTILTADATYSALDRYLRSIGVKTVFLVCDASLEYLRIAEYLQALSERDGISVIRFSDFSPNPVYESVRQGVALFKEKQCDSILAVGGGSAIDVAKCIKLYVGMNDAENYLAQPVISNTIPLICAPTTAGTGSEATQFAVIYLNGEKQSVSHPDCIPCAVLFDPDFLRTLPAYQKKSTMLDAFCHALESLWSVRSTPESMRCAEQALHLLIEKAGSYLAHGINGAEMLSAANLAGKAINISQTTAGHAMAYKLTSLYGIAHGHAASICVSALFPFMVDHMDLCADPRGRAHLERVFARIAEAFHCADAADACVAVRRFIDAAGLERPHLRHPDEMALLCGSVNPVRLKNNPIPLDTAAIRTLYGQILNEQVK